MKVDNTEPSLARDGFEGVETSGTTRPVDPTLIESDLNKKRVAVENSLKSTDDIVRSTLENVEVSRNDSPTVRWKIRRCSKVYEILARYSDIYLEALYNEFPYNKSCISKLILRIEGLRNDDSAAVRRYLGCRFVLSPADQGILARVDNYYFKSDDERISIKKARQQGLTEYWKSADSSALTKFGKQISIARTTYRSGYSEEELLQNKTQMQWFYRLSEEEQAVRRKLVSDSWSRLSDEERALRGANIYKGQKEKDSFGGYRYFKATVQGLDLHFHSTWEYFLYIRLLEFNVNFKFANREGTALLLKTKSWSPDFIIGNTIIEVKGHPQAYQKFYNTDFPQFLQSEYSKIYDLWLLEKSIERLKLSNLDDILALCKLKHRAE